MGDFRQILPVVQGGRHEDIVHETIKTSELWGLFATLRLTIKMRVERIAMNNPERRNELRNYSDWLLQVGE
eukprot:3296701-Ditylum_brightwellii.AAC.1